jgi:hypothetical protein
MKITRTEEGKYTRITTLTINEDTVKRINEDLDVAIVNGVKFKPLTIQEVIDLVSGAKSSRGDEEYFVELEFYSGNMKLGAFIRCEINDIFEELPADEIHEEPDYWTDEIYP